MGFNDRVYDVYVILGDPQEPPSWTVAGWARIVPFLDCLISAARGKASVRSHQYVRGGGSPSKSEVRFGRIGWSAAGHQKWLHEAAVNKQINFFDAEVVAPSMAYCVREERAPDLFFKLENEQYSPEDEVKFNPLLILAVATDVSENFRAAGQAAAIGISDAVAALLRVRRQRPWCYMLDHPERENGIMDYSPFRPGPRQKWPISLEMFERKWEEF